MKVVCAWCGKDMGEKPPYEDTDSTHAICPKCYRKVRGKEEGGKMPHDKSSPHCQRVLEDLEEGRIPCGDFRATRSGAMCLAFDIMHEKNLNKLPLKEAWRHIKTKCSTPDNPIV